MTEDASKRRMHPPTTSRSIPTTRCNPPVCKYVQIDRTVEFAPEIRKVKWATEGLTKSGVNSLEYI